MSDRRLRDVQRRWMETQADDDFLTYYTEMERAGRYDLMADCPRKVTGYLARYDWAEGGENPLAVILGREERIIPTQSMFLGRILDFTYASGALHILHQKGSNIITYKINPDGTVERIPTRNSVIGLRTINGTLAPLHHMDHPEIGTRLIRSGYEVMRHRSTITPLNEQEMLVAEYGEFNVPDRLQIVRFDGTHLRYPIQEFGRPVFSQTVMVENSKVIAGRPPDKIWLFEDGTTSPAHNHREYEIQIPMQSRAYQQTVEGKIIPCEENHLAKIYAPSAHPRAWFAEIPKECLEGLVKAHEREL